MTKEAKKILRKKNKEFKSKLKILMPSFIVVLLVLSSLGFILGQKGGQENTLTNVKDYNGFKFYKTQNDKWVTNVGGVQYWFDYLPEDLVNISIPDFVVPNKVYFLFNPLEKDNNMDYVMSKLSYVLSNLRKKMVPACISEQGCPDIPLKNCSEDFSFYFVKLRGNNASGNETSKNKRDGGNEINEDNENENNEGKNSGEIQGTSFMDDKCVVIKEIQLVLVKLLIKLI